jgi:hypothetical protein
VPRENASGVGQQVRTPEPAGYSIPIATLPHRPIAALTGFPVIAPLPHCLTAPLIRVGLCA